MANRKWETGIDVAKTNPRKWNHMEKTYKKVQCDLTGRYMLEEDGEVDVREYIQKYKDQTNINNYIKTDDNGEVVAVHEINKSKAHYGDFTEVPETRAEMIDTINDGKKLGKWLTKQQEIEIAKLKKDKEDAAKIEADKKEGEDK